MQTVTHRDALARFGCALSDPTRVEILLLLRDGPGYPPIWPTRSGCPARSCPTTSRVCAGAGWWSPNPRAAGRATNWPTPESRHALNDLLGLVLAVDPACCPAADTDDCC